MQNKYFLIMLLATIATINATYLSYKAYTYHSTNQSTIQTVCDAFGRGSCSDVLAHPLSLVFGVPFPWIAMLVYPLLFAFAWRGYQKNSPKPVCAIRILALTGVLFNSLII